MNQTEFPEGAQGRFRPGARFSASDLAFRIMAVVFGWWAWGRGPWLSKLKAVLVW